MFSPPIILQLTEDMIDVTYSIVIERILILQCEPAQSFSSHYKSSSLKPIEEVGDEAASKQRLFNILKLQTCVCVYLAARPVEVNVFHYTPKSIL